MIYSKRHKKKTVKQPKPEPPKRVPLPPFNCGETRIFALAGEIIASSAAEYKLAGKHAKRARLQYQLNYPRMTEGKLKEIEGEMKGIMAREKAFILSERFQILLGKSSLDGVSVIRALDNEIETYDPVPDVPEINPRTGEPYDLKAWRRWIKKSRTVKAV